MQALLIQILGGLVRLALGGVVTWLVTNGVIQEGQTAQLLTGLTTGLVACGWVVWNKIKERRELNTALNTSKPVTLDEVKAMIQAGKGAPATLNPGEVMIGGTTIPRTGHE